MNLIDADALIHELNNSHYPGAPYIDAGISIAIGKVCDAPPAEPENCEGCKHFGKWENEVEYGYPSPCTRCKRRVEDHYER